MVLCKSINHPSLLLAIVILKEGQNLTVPPSGYNNKENFTKEGNPNGQEKEENISK